MQRTILLLLAFTLLAAFVVDDAAAQGRRGRGGRRGQFDPVDLLKRIDKNGNGQIDPDEVTERSRGFIDQAATRAGLDPKQPLSVEKLSSAVKTEGGEDKEDDDKPKEGEAAKPAEGSRPASGAETPKTETPPATTEPAKVAPPLVPGFGTATTIKPPPGFDPPAPSQKSSTGSPRNGSGSSSARATSSGSNSNSAGSADKREQAQKFRRYAEGLMKRYDESNNGVLERDEWKKMSGDPEKADANKDGTVTVEELTDRLASYGSDDGSSSGGDGKSNDKRERKEEDRRKDRDRPREDRSESKGASDRKSYRFLTTAERLPKGLPAWFGRNDADGDGQVTMSEYSTSYNDTTVAEFQKYDRDGDGIITPHECLLSEKDKTAKKP
jgi:Ca2+-binding EF-hand superfamily protein